MQAKEYASSQNLITLCRMTMVTATRRKSNAPLTWKALLVGGIIGSLSTVALMKHVEEIGFSRRLSEHIEDVVIEEGSEGEGHHEIDEVRKKLNSFWSYQARFFLFTRFCFVSLKMVLDSTVAFIILLLIVLTIAFETAKEHIEEAADRSMRPIIGSLFGEMTVLGFLSIFTFCVTKLGVFETISISLFGEEEELLETFEFVHYMLFFIMIFFVISVLIMVSGAEHMGEMWWTLNQATSDDRYMDKLDAIPVEPSATSWVAYLCSTLFPCSTRKTSQFRSDLRLFRSLRKEFILERSVDHPFHPNPNCVDDDFDFGRYLSLCLGHSLAHIVHLSHLTWGFFALLTLAFYGAMVVAENDLVVRH